MHTQKVLNFKLHLIFFFSLPWHLVLLIRYCSIPPCISWAHVFILFLLLNYKLIENKNYLAHLSCP